MAKLNKERIQEATLEEILETNQVDPFNTKVEIKEFKFQDNRQVKKNQMVPSPSNPNEVLEIRRQMRADVDRKTNEMSAANEHKSTGTRVKLCGNKSTGERCQGEDCGNWHTELFEEFKTNCLKEADILNNLRGNK